MQGSQTLNEASVERALAILEREQRELLPTEWQRRWYRLLNWALGMFFPALILFVAIAKYEEDQDVTLQWAASLVVTFVLFASVLPLFLLNIPLMRRLKRHADLRTRVGLGESLRAEFARARNQGRIRNMFTALMVPLGAVVILASIIGFVTSLVELREAGEFAILFVVTALAFFFALFFGLGLVSLHFIRRAKERLEIVVSLQDSLENHHEAMEGEGAMVEIDPESYRHIAGIERTHIARDRRESIRQARQEEQGAYLVQTSRAALAARTALEPRSQLRVEDQVLALTREPRPIEAFIDDETGLLVLEVPETSVRLEYRVDDSARKIQVYSVEPTGGIGPSGSGGETV